MIRELDVYLSEQLVGRLEYSDDGKISFAYQPDAQRPISVGMPLEIKRFENAHCEAFFGGLLPEGEEARKVLGKRFGISSSNTFSLLRAIGAECAGALSIVEAGQVPLAAQPLSVNVLSEQELAAHIRELPERPLFVGVNGIRLSLSGVQDKAAVTLLPEGIGIPSSGPTTHILKPDLRHARGAIYCEHLCLRIASILGLDAARVQMGRAEDQVYLLVERFDRHRQNDVLVRVHQEDFCQALGIPSSRKYEDDGGPKLADCFQLLDKTTAPIKERLKLLTAVLFNFLVGNMDAHGKNFSLLHGRRGISVAPLYDVITTLAFPEYSAKLAMDIGDTFSPNEVNAYQWRLLCEDINYSFPAFKRLAKRLYQSLPAAADTAFAEMVSTGWHHEACDRAVQIIKNNCVEMEARLSV